MTQRQALHPLLDRIQRPALLVGVGGLVLCVVGFFISRHYFFRSYLLAYLYWLGLPLGCMGILMLQHLTGGRWGLVIRRPLESGARILPLMAILFLPLLLGLHELYIWARPEDVKADPALQYKQPYLNIGAFMLRAAIYFAIWIVGSFLLNRWSAVQDRTGDPRLVRRLQLMSGPGIVLYVLTMTLAAVDWVMSIDPHWYSTIFGLVFVTGQALLTLSIMIVLAALLSGISPMREILTRDHFQDLGNLLLTFVLLWAYMQFSQFLIIWMANIAEETPYYIARTRGPMGAVALLIVILHFGVQFLLLLSRRAKRSVQMLATIAAGIAVLRFVDLFWIIKPMFAQHHHDAHEGFGHMLGGLLLDLIAVAGIGGIVVAFFLWQLSRWPLIPRNDPRLAELEGRHHG